VQVLGYLNPKLKCAYIINNPKKQFFVVLRELECCAQSISPVKNQPSNQKNFYLSGLIFGDG